MATRKGLFCLNATTRGSRKQVHGSTVHGAQQAVMQPTYSTLHDFDNGTTTHDITFGKYLTANLNHLSDSDVAPVLVNSDSYQTSKASDVICLLIDIE